MGLIQFRDGGFSGHEDAVQDSSSPLHEEDSVPLELTPELRAALLDPESWGKILGLYARTMKLAVALIDADGNLVGACQNPQPIWTLARAARPALAGSCIFCLEALRKGAPSPDCSAAADAFRTGSLSLAHDPAGFAHSASALTLGGQHLGTLLAGQVLDRYPEPLPLQRLAREFGLSPQAIWDLARQAAPTSRANLTVYGDLLFTLGQTFLRDRYGAILERRLTEKARALNQELQSLNSALRETEQRAETAKVYAENIVATVREPLLVLDETFRVTSANDGYYRKFQVSAAQTEGRSLYALGSGEWDLPELRRLLSEVLPLNQWVQDFEIELDFDGMGRRTMMLNARRIDHVDLILLAIEDITERKQAENLLRKLNRDMQTFSYAASHDLQEPLRMVLSYTQLLAREYKGKLDARADEFIAHTIEGAQRLQTLLRDLREYWLVTEQMEQRVPIDSAGVLQKTIQTLRVLIEESGAIVTHGALPTLLGEEISIATLFQNLLGNAIKYRRPEEPPDIYVMAQKTANVWCFSVKDNGIGIKADHLEEIFAPFKRLHGREYPGSGIGLALCHRIVERYGGRIWVESTHGQGSTFCFTIPVGSDPVAAGLDS